MINCILFSLLISASSILCGMNPENSIPKPKDVNLSYRMKYNLFVANLKPEERKIFNESPLETQELFLKYGTELQDSLDLNQRFLESKNTFEYMCGGIVFGYTVLILAYSGLLSSARSR